MRGLGLVSMVMGVGGVGWAGGIYPLGVGCLGWVWAIVINLPRMVCC